ncbi:MAG: N-6 DNA methylase [Bradyrhizobium sp.]|uniref:Eco57I restriction-modification methylase domain-containing protein n=1 Tax=Bradyrhizobium sp. TaxID=376 RepID=UPI0029BDDA37|nr:N-6 DNA methylase [Bradyrhizobium sp.]MDX3968135.1 N-6 DNA methylase [Bradyrhizobium sp.]
MPKPDDHFRNKARFFEAALPAEQRKRLGQFFTGLRLGKLLSHLALSPTTLTVVDPMAGHGDLLDSAVCSASEIGLGLRGIVGIEIESSTAEFCSARLNSLCADRQMHAVVPGSAFALSTIQGLPIHSFDLAITNPPYVRYQAQDRNHSVRRGLASIIDAIKEGPERVLWRKLAEGYSGLADLSIPASMLAALLVAPGGRLALVLPATWRNREYGDILRYLLLRCFEIEYIVEDTQPGWFSTALVRTNLVIARRLGAHETDRPLVERTALPTARHVQIAPRAANSESLVGSAFTEVHPEAAMANWLHLEDPPQRPGIAVRNFSLEQEFSGLESRLSRRSWFKALEGNRKTLPLFSKTNERTLVLPEAVRDVFKNGIAPASTASLEEVGIHVGQGLRTGCNWFFYVDAREGGDKEFTRIRASSAFGHREFQIPNAVLRPVLRRQSELFAVETGLVVPGRVLDLRKFVLPEDAEAVVQARETYRARGEDLPETMTGDLAEYVRLGGTIESPELKRAPELSAVRTNVRSHKRNSVSPRFWYMLPDFMPRHEPAAFVARINHDAPWVECNVASSILIDANFSTFWCTSLCWTRFAIKALLNSTWCQLFMEALGTPMGGGALKLEAVQLKQLRLPRLSDEQLRQLDKLGRDLSRNNLGCRARIDVILTAGVQQNIELLDAMAERTESLRQMRLRRAA